MNKVNEYGGCIEYIIYCKFLKGARYMDMRYSRRFVRDGNETASFFAVIIESTDAISGFYRELAERCEVWCGESLGSIEAYRDRGYHAVRYGVETRVIAKSEREMDVALRVTLKSGALGSKTLFSEIHRWSIAEGVMLPPKKKKHYKVSKPPKRAKKKYIERN